MIKSKTKVRIFSSIVVMYMLFALTWWAILLYQKTETIHDLQIERSDLYPNASKESFRQKVMIVGEGIVFALSLTLGIILLNGAFRREMKVAKQQKNFLLSVTHELKSPITALQLILDTFKKRKLSDEQSNALIANGQAEADRLKKLVEDLLLAAKLNPKEVLSKDKINLTQLLKQLINQYQKNYPEFNFISEYNGQDHVINAHKESMFLVVSNLLENAVKYSDGNPRIEIEAKDSEGFTFVSVKDHGVGISDEEKANIFNQFYRIGNEETRSSKGTGLGLFLVKELCDKMQIKISVSDNKPQGSCFLLKIPK